MVAIAARSHSRTASAWRPSAAHCCGQPAVVAGGHRRERVGGRTAWPRTARAGTPARTAITITTASSATSTISRAWPPAAAGQQVVDAIAQPVPQPLERAGAAAPVGRVGQLGPGRPLRRRAADGPAGSGSPRAHHALTDGPAIGTPVVRRAARAAAP